jgi:hypothetical protein
VGKVIAFVLHGEGSITDKARVSLRHYIQRHLETTKPLHPMDMGRCFPHVTLTFPLRVVPMLKCMALYLHFPIRLYAVMIKHKDKLKCFLSRKCQRLVHRDSGTL